MSSDNEEYSSDQHLKSHSNAPKKQSSIRSFLVSKDVKSEQLDEEQSRNESIDALGESDSSFEEDQVEKVASTSNPKRKRIRKQGECVECKGRKKIKAKDMCDACYARAFRTLPEYNVPNCCCIECMAVSKVDKHGRCRKCSNSKHLKLHRSNVNKHRECKTCKQTKLIEARGLCHTCYQRSKSKTKQKCQGCGQTKILLTKNTCNVCYRKRLAETDIRMCKNCGEMRSHCSDQMCRQCYNKIVRTDPSRKKECVKCKQAKFIHGHGMCEQCYNKTRREDPKQHKECVKCGQVELIHGHGMCKTCCAITRKEDPSQHKKCSGCKQIKPIHARECCQACYMKIFANPRYSAKKKLIKKSKQIKTEPIDDVKMEELDNEPGPSWR